MVLLKFFMLVVVVLAISFFLEFARVEYGVPVTLMDLIFLVAIFLMCFYILRSFFPKSDKENYAVGISTKKLLKYLFFFSFIAIPFGFWSVWGIWAGKVGPFDYFSGGSRGAVHGYTLISLGLLFLIMWACVFFKIIRKLLIKKGV